VILSVNGRRIGNTKDYWDAVKSSPQTMEFTVRDVRDGSARKLRVQLMY
jgi:S1-C subfamily serine protease